MKMVGNLVGSAGLAAIELGIYLLFGAGWALLVGGVIVFGFGWAIWDEANTK